MLLAALLPGDLFPKSIGRRGMASTIPARTTSSLTLCASALAGQRQSRMHTACDYMYEHAGLDVHVHLHMLMLMYRFTCIHACLLMYAHMSVRIRMCLCVCAYRRQGIDVFTDVLVYGHARTCACVCIQMCMRT